MALACIGTASMWFLLSKGSPYVRAYSAAAREGRGELGLCYSYSNTCCCLYKLFNGPNKFRIYENLRVGLRWENSPSVFKNFRANSLELLLFWYCWVLILRLNRLLFSGTHAHHWNLIYHIPMTYTIHILYSNDISCIYHTPFLYHIPMIYINYIYHSYAIYQ